MHSLFIRIFQIFRVIFLDVVNQISLHKVFATIYYRETLEHTEVVTTGCHIVYGDKAVNFVWVSNSVWPSVNRFAIYFHIFTFAACHFGINTDTHTLTAGACHKVKATDK